MQTLYTATVPQAATNGRVALRPLSGEYRQTEMSYIQTHDSQGFMSA